MRVIEISAVIAQCVGLALDNVGVSANQVIHCRNDRFTAVRRTEFHAVLGQLGIYFYR